MDGTPTSNRILRSRHVPTPKFEERKKNLFGESNETVTTPRRTSVRRPVIREYDEDSDLGPMSPLQFSSSPTNFNRHHGIIKESMSNRHKNFTNILNEMSIEQKYSLKRLTVNLGRKVCIDSDDDDLPKSNVTTDIDNEDGVAPLCESMGKMATDPPTPITTANAFCDEENYEKQLKTPSESTTHIASTDQLFRGQSFRKALLLDAELTPNEAESTSQMPRHDKEASIDRPKAKTSLIFSEPTISTKSFYGLSSAANSSLLNRFGNGISVNDEKRFPIVIDEKKFPIMSIISKFKKQSSTHRKQQSSKRSKWTGPSLWRHGGIHKPTRFKRCSNSVKHSKNTHKALDITTTSSTSIDSIENNNQRTAKKISRRSTFDTKKRHQAILKDQNSPQISNRATGTTSDADSEYEDDDDDDDENDPLLKGIGILCGATKDTENDEPETQMNRKFFKSKANTVTKKYQIINGLCATLKRGNDFKLELPAKRVRRSKVPRKQINNIIANLLSPKKSNDVNITDNSHVSHTSELNLNQPSELSKIPYSQSSIDDVTSKVNVNAPIADENIYRQMIPYNTIDSNKISQQESILELLISNDICNEETFKIFIAEPDLHKDKASAILDELYCMSKLLPEDENDGILICEWESAAGDMPMTSEALTEFQTLNVIPTVGNDVDKITDVPMSPATQISAMASTLVLDCASEQTNADDSSLFPIFRKDFQEPQPIRDLYTHIANTSKNTMLTTNVWKPIGNEQYQIDAGQKEFGMKQCAQCGMTYSVHEPEDELLHLKYHNSVDILTFKGWTDERLVSEIPEWGINGRIIYVCETDTKIKKNRIKDILTLVDRDLGFSMSELVPKSLVYLGIARNQIVGVCVAQPLQEAHRYIHKDGLDCCSTATYPAKCGISRIWVAPTCRRFGIASKMITTLRGHFIFGSFLSFNDIAFSSPTETGKKLAAQITGRDDFLIYER